MPLYIISIIKEIEQDINTNRVGHIDYINIPLKYSKVCKKYNLHTIYIFSPDNVKISYQPLSDSPTSL